MIIGCFFRFDFFRNRDAAINFIIRSDFGENPCFARRNTRQNARRGDFGYLRILASVSIVQYAVCRFHLQTISDADCYVLLRKCSLIRIGNRRFLATDRNKQGKHH